MDKILPRIGGMVVDITGQTVLITGAAQGIGLAYAERFATEGAQVIIAISTLNWARRLLMAYRKPEASRRKFQPVL